MRIDDFDHTLVCDEEDFQTVLGYFKDYRALPDYIEISVLKILLNRFNKGSYDFKTVDDYFRLIPDDYINKIIKDINSMFCPQSKAEYLNRHLSYLLILV